MMSMSMSMGCHLSQRQDCAVCGEPRRSRARFDSVIGPMSSRALLSEGICPLCLSFPRDHRRSNGDYEELIASWESWLEERREEGVVRADGVTVCPPRAPALPFDME